jgi:isopenicillin-N epimerase
VAEICRRAREAGILTIADGAHAPGQVPLNLVELGADLYTGACHKWLCAPKGAAFLYARPEIQPWLEPLVVSWGWESDQPSPSRFVDWHEWQGTRDIAAYLAVPAAIAFQAEHDWESVRRRCHALAIETRERIVDLTGLPPICPDDAPRALQSWAVSGLPPGLGTVPVRGLGDQRDAWFNQFFTARLPELDLEALKARLYDEYRVEVPMIRWNGQPFVRVSFQAYNDRGDADALVDALARLLPELRREP